MKTLPIKEIEGNVVLWNGFATVTYGKKTRYTPIALVHTPIAFSRKVLFKWGNSWIESKKAGRIEEFKDIFHDAISGVYPHLEHRIEVAMGNNKKRTVK